MIIFYVYKTIAGFNITVQETKSHLAPGHQEWHTCGCLEANQSLPVLRNNRARAKSVQEMKENPSTKWPLHTGFFFMFWAQSPESFLKLYGMHAPISECGFPCCISSIMHAQNGGSIKPFLIVNFLKSRCTTDAQFLIFLNIHHHQSAVNFFPTSVRSISKYFLKLPFFIFLLICEKLSGRF